MGGVTGLDASASIAGEEPKLAQLWDTFVQANPNLPELASFLPLYFTGYRWPRLHGQ